jgi:hypothetical protein
MTEEKTNGKRLGSDVYQAWRNNKLVQKLWSGNLNKYTTWEIYTYVEDNIKIIIKYNTKYKLNPIAQYGVQWQKSYEQ